MTPTFSVLLPTRDRLEYLRLAVESVRRQDDDDWEIVVADNCSTGDVGDAVGFGTDSRIKLVRSDVPLHVTENWERALSASTGNYIVMLGDDDILAPGYFRRMRDAINEFDPDLVYTGAYLFAYPGVMPDAVDGYLQPYSYATFAAGAKEAFRLDRDDAVGAVEDALHFRVRFGFNMQFALLRRDLTERVAGNGAFFRSDFPDYFAMNAAFLMARALVVVPDPCVVIGVTPRSYGFFHATGEEDAGRAILRADTSGRDELPEGFLPGSNINNGWLSALLALEEAFGADLPTKPRIRRYRWLQSLYVHEQHYLRHAIDRNVVLELRRRLTVAGRVASLVASAALRCTDVLGPRIQRVAANRIVPRLQLGQLMHFDVDRIVGQFADAMEVFDALEGGGAVTSGPR